MKAFDSILFSLLKKLLDYWEYRGSYIFCLFSKLLFHSGYFILHFFRFFSYPYPFLIQFSYKGTGFLKENDRLIFASTLEIELFR